MFTTLCKHGTRTYTKESRIREPFSSPTRSVTKLFVSMYKIIRLFLPFIKQTLSIVINVLSWHYFEHVLAPLKWPQNSNYLLVIINFLKKFFKTTSYHGDMLIYKKSSLILSFNTFKWLLLIRALERLIVVNGRELTIKLVVSLPSIERTSVFNSL